MQWTESFDDTDLPPTTVLGFKLFVKTLVGVWPSSSNSSFFFSFLTRLV